MSMVVKIGDRKVFVGLIDLLTIGMLVIALAYVVIIGIRHPATTYFDRPDTALRLVVVEWRHGQTHSSPSASEC